MWEWTGRENALWPFNQPFSPFLCGGLRPKANQLTASRWVLQGKALGTASGTVSELQMLKNQGRLSVFKAVCGISSVYVDTGECNRFEKFEVVLQSW